MVFGTLNALLLDREIANYSPDQMVVAGDRMYTDR
jgi:hypothetical protein